MNTWLIYFEDAAVRPVVFYDEGAARHYYAERSKSWNCHLFQMIATNVNDERAALKSTHKESRNE